MFHGNRWAAAFVAALGEDAQAGFTCLKAMVSPVKAVSGTLFGYSASRRLEKLLRECAVGAVGGAVDGEKAVEYAIRFITVVVEKRQFEHIDVIVRKIEERLDAQRGVLAVTVEAAAPMDSAFEEKFKQHIMERLGAAEIKMKVVLIPGLLGGYRLRIGGFYIDASLKGQIEKMKAGLTGGMKYGGL